jgi:cytochrome b pre-mRNA-processing protein 3
MFKRLFGRERAVNRDVIEALYAAIVAAARRETYFSQWDVPDTPLGRFEMISLHMVLVQHRLRDAGGGAAEIAQELIDDFFTDVDHSLRELGIGDLGVPKRMKKLARMYYGRTLSYAAAVEAGDREALAAALARNIRPDAVAWPHAGPLAGHVLASSAALAALPVESILQGRLAFADPAAEDRGAAADEPA